MLETRAALPSFLSAHSTHSCVNVNTQLIMLLSSVCNQALSGPIESLSNPRQLSLPDLWPVYMTRLTQSYSHGNHFLYFFAARASPCQSSKLTKKNGSHGYLQVSGARISMEVQFSLVFCFVVVIPMISIIPDFIPYDNSMRIMWMKFSFSMFRKIFSSVREKRPLFFSLYI